MFYKHVRGHGRVKRKTVAKVFADIKIGEIFSHNGTEWLKRSTRTAQVHNGYPSIFYFSKNEILYPNIKVNDDYYGV